jgi:hypothetical protein
VCDSFVASTKEVNWRLFLEEVEMRIDNRDIFPLKNGCLFVVLTVFGCKGERLSLAEQGISRKLVFFHEAPKTNIQCSYFPAENELELGGAEMETERTLYLIVSNGEARYDNYCNSQ